MRYCKFSEEELKKALGTRNIESAVSQMLNEGYTPVSITYISDVRGYGPSGYYVYHFVK